MIDIDELRRLTQEATPGPWKILPVGDGRQKFAVADRKSLSILTVTDEGEATFGTVHDDADAKFIAAANPATISELLDRLEAAESALSNLGVTPEEAKEGLARHKATLARLEVVEKEYQHVLEVKEIYQRQLNETEDERDELRAMIMVALDVLEDVKGNINPERGYADELEADVERAIAVIVIPSAKGE